MAEINLAALEGRIDEDCHWSAEEALAILARARRADELEEPYVDGEGTSWRVPTAYAYAKACAALHKHEARARQLEEHAGRLAQALTGLQLQALQSDVNNPANTWGREALAVARAALAEFAKLTEAKHD